MSIDNLSKDSTVALTSFAIIKMMTVRIVTDSASDIPKEISESLGISVVPITISFGEEIYRDGIDITINELSHKIDKSPEYPKTAHPTVASFAATYRSIAESGDSIVSIHLSDKLSGTFHAASLASRKLEKGCRIEVIDSRTVSMGLGLIVIAAARAVQAGKSFVEVVQSVYQDISKIRLAAYFETLEYLYRGGRIGKARALFGSLLHVKPLIVVNDGEVQPLCYTRTRTGALRRLRDYVKSLLPIRELAVMYGENKESADTLVEMLSDLCEENHIIQTQAGVTLGVHAGAQTLALSALLE